jgi:isoquinoline 1-oxidoreductase beta subunit
MRERFMTTGGEIDRRSFLVGAGAAGGLALGFAVPVSVSPANAAAAACEINCWIMIAPDDTVTVRTAHAEMGQGVMTALAMLVAEELECDWAKVRPEFVAPDQNLRRARAWGDMSTGASKSISS